MRTRILGSIGLTLWAAMAWSQPAPAGPLSAELRARLQNAKFGIITSVRGLPLGVRERLQTMWATGSLDIAEPGGEFQMAGRAATAQLPLRRMIAAGCSSDFYCLIYYERGGSSRTWRTALFHWSPDATRLEWGSTAPGSFTTIEEVRKAILSGQIKGDQAALW